MTPSSRPTLVLVQGLCQTPLVYHEFVQYLEDFGFPVVHPHLPSCTDPEAPDFSNRSLVDDALSIRMEVIRLVEYQFKKVVLVMHSYGGIVGSEAVPKELSYRHRQSKNLAGGVIYLFYYSAFILGRGRSIADLPDESIHTQVQPNGRFIIRDAAKTLYNDVPEFMAKYWESIITPQSLKVQQTDLTVEAYRYIPSTYLICENDQAILPEFQEMFAKIAGARIDRCSAGHSPHLSQMSTLIRKIIEANPPVMGPPLADGSNVSSDHTLQAGGKTQSRRVPQTALEARITAGLSRSQNPLRTRSPHSSRNPPSTAGPSSSRNPPSTAGPSSSRKSQSGRRLPSSGSHPASDRPPSGRQSPANESPSPLGKLAPIKE